MNIQELTQAILQFCQDREWEKFHAPKNLAIAVSTEASELLENFQWLTLEESKNLNPTQKAAVRDEIGDVMICLLNLAARLGIDPVDAAVKKLVKNDAKYPVEKARGTATKYTDLK